VPTIPAAADAAPAPFATRCTALSGAQPSPLEGKGPLTTVFAKAINGTSVTLTEGPVWNALRQELLFTEPLANRVWSFSPPSTLTLRSAKMAFADGLDFLPSGELLAAENKTAGLSVYDPVSLVRKRSILPPAGAVEDTNDVVARGDGTIFFTVPAANKVFRIDPGATVAVLATDTVAHPNGIALSPDEKTLYVVSDVAAAPAVKAFLVQPNGTVTARPTAPSFTVAAGPDGITVDRAGNLYLAARDAAAVQILTPLGSELGRMATPSIAFNVAFGGVDYKTLFIAAFDKDNTSGALYSVKMRIEGCPQ
jgi:gluconolactonase